IKKSDYDFHLIGDYDVLLSYDWVENLENIKSVINIKSPIYSVTEQIQLYRAIPRSTSLFWAPHYNIPLLYKSILLVTVHDVFHLAVPEFTKGIIKRLYAKIMFSGLIKNASSIVSVSHFTKNELQRLLDIETPIFPIHNGVDKVYNIDKIQKKLHPRPY